MSLCVMFSRFEQQQQQQQQQHHHHHPDHHHHHLHHRDGRNNKADRSRHLWQPWVERAGGNFDDRSRSLSLRCSAMEGTMGTVGKWKRERRHRAVCTSPVSPPPPSSSYLRNSQEPLDMTTTASNAASRALLPKERASVIMAAAAAASSSTSVAATGHRTSTSSGISDPVIDEHFRRSLGKDYMNVFAPAVIARRDQTPVADPTDVAGGSGDDNDDDDDDDDDDDEAGLSAVDDHFAKALGDTWVKLQKEEYQKKRKESTSTGGDGGSRQKVNVYAA